MLTLSRIFYQVAKMSLKIHFFHPHLDFFPTNMGEISDENNERFHQEIKKMGNRYQGRITINMLADYSWFLQRESDTMYKAWFIRTSTAS